jgi:hypothetical protein
MQFSEGWKREASVILRLRNIFTRLWILTVNKTVLNFSKVNAAITIDKYTGLKIGINIGIYQRDLKFCSVIAILDFYILIYYNNSCLNLMGSFHFQEAPLYLQYSP